MNASEITQELIQAVDKHGNQPFNRIEESTPGKTYSHDAKLQPLTATIAETASITFDGIQVR